MDRVEPLLTQADAAELTRQFADLKRVLTFASQVEQIRLRRASVAIPGQGSGNAVAATAYATAFEDLGISPLADDDSKEAKLRSTGLAPEFIMSALVDYARVLPDQAESKRLFALATKIDPRLLELAKRVVAAMKGGSAEMTRLVSQLDRESHPPMLIGTLAATLIMQGLPDQAIRLLQGYQITRPADFWVNLWLAEAHFRSPRPDLPEALRFFSAALAQRPDDPDLLIAVTHVLRSLGRRQEAAAYQERALHVAPDHPGLKELADQD